jgi:cephalosporin-C deacetylase
MGSLLTLPAMPQVDKPLSQLQVYSGINPRPEDHDEYWTRALAELAQVDPQVDLQPASFQSTHAECFDLYFTGVRGARIYAQYARPRHAPKPHPAVLQFHGYSGHSGNWVHKLAYATEGMAIAAMDCRGQGGKSSDAGGVWGNTLNGHIIRGLSDHPDKLLFRDIFLDTALLARIVMGFSEVDPHRVGAFGGSQGGGLTLACAALEPRIKRAAPVYPFLSDYKRVWEMDLTKDAYLELKTVLQKNLWVKKVFFWDKRQNFFAKPPMPSI